MAPWFTFSVQCKLFIRHSEQLEAVYDDATEKVRTAVELDAHAADIVNGRLQPEHLPRIDVVRIEWLRAQRLAGAVGQRDAAVFAGEAALELYRNGADAGCRRAQQDGNVLRCALLERRM